MAERSSTTLTRFAPQIVNAAAEPLLLLDDGLTVCAANPAFGRIAQADPAALVGLPAGDVLWAWVGVPLGEQLPAVLADGGEAGISLAGHLPAIGGGRQVVTARRLADPDRGPPCLLLSFCERVEPSGWAAPTDGRLLQAMIEALPVGVCYLGRDLQPVVSNRAAHEVWGCTPEPATAISFSGVQGHWPESGRLLGDDEWPPIRALQSGEPVLDDVIQLTLPNGRRRALSISAVPLRGPDGTVSGVLVVSSDVTQERETELALRESEQRYRSLFEHFPEPAFWFDLEGRFISANPAAQRLSGMTAAQLLGRTFDFMIPREELPRVRERFRAAASGVAQSYHAAMRNAAGERVELAVTNVPIMVGGRVTGVYGIAQDMTEHRRLEEQLRQAQKMEAIGRLAGGIAHDFNNLLTAILTDTELALRDFPAPSVAEDLAQIGSTARRAAVLVRQLLAFSRKQVLQLQPVALNEVIEETRSMLRRMIGEDVVIVTDLEPGLGPVLADPGQLEQVLMNLAVNARDAMPDGGTLTLTTDNVLADPALRRRHKELPPGAYARLTVRDTGVGMTADVLEQIFEPFFTTKPVGQGTGLGLATVYGILKQSGGFVAVESAPGEGTGFEILLPLVGNLGPGPILGGAVLGPAAHGGDETVLVVEDEDTVRRSVERILRRVGYTVTSVRNGAEALAVFQADPTAYDLVVTDVVMPELGGHRLAALLREARPDLPLLLMSGYDDPAASGGTGLPDGAGFLEKPFTLDALLRQVRLLLDGGAD